MPWWAWILVGWFALQPLMLLWWATLPRGNDGENQPNEISVGYVEGHRIAPRRQDQQAARRER